MSESNRPTGGRPRTFDRERVVEVAMDSYWREGLDAISLNEICRRAAVSKPGLYREFGGEDGLMDAALEHYASTVLVANFAAVDPEATFQQVLSALVAAFTDPERAGPVGCLLARMQHAGDHLGPKTAARVEALRNHARAAFAELIEKAKQRGEVTVNVSTEVAAAMLDIQCNTVLMQMAIGEDPDLLRAQAMLAFSGLSEGRESG